MDYPIYYQHLSKAIIETEFTSIIHAKENVIYSSAILIQDENSKEVCAETWYLKYDLTKLENLFFFINEQEN